MRITEEQFLAKYPIYKKHYVKYDPNPKATKQTCDCVVRAFCKLLNAEWNKVYILLCRIGEKLYDMPNSPKVEKHLLKQLGFQEVTRQKGMPKWNCKELCEGSALNGNSFYCFQNGHVFAIEKGKAYDKNPFIFTSGVNKVWIKTKTTISRYKQLKSKYNI